MLADVARLWGANGIDWGVYKGLRNGGAGRNRTDDRGVAVHCITTLLRRLKLSLYYLLLYYLSSVILEGRKNLNSLWLLIPCGLRCARC